VTVPRVLLLSTWSPSYKHAGTVFHETLVEHYPAGKLCCFFLSPDLNIVSHPRHFAGAPVYYASLPREHAIRPFGPRIGHLSTFILHQYIRHVRTHSLLRKAAQIAQNFNVDMIWAPLILPTLIYMAKRLADDLRLPLITSVMDPPERPAFDKRIDSLSTHTMQRIFVETLQRSERCSVASWAMKEEYETRYGVNSVVLIHGVHPNLIHPPATQLAGKETLVIGFAGLMYAHNEWKALLEALSSVDWRIDKRKIIVRVLSEWVPIQAKGRLHIELLGWRSLKETIDIMSSVDIAYVPYWFDKAMSSSVRLCFPNKLSAYLAAGRPVLYHGPEDASPAQFIKKYGVGTCCHSCRKSDIIKSLTHFVSHTDLYAQAARQAHLAVEQELNLRVFLRRFAELLGIDETELLPMSEPAAL